MINYGRLALLFAFCLILAVSLAQAKSEFGGEIAYSGLYESNIFHSYEDTLEEPDMVNTLTTKFYWKNRISRAFKQLAMVYSDFDIYTAKSDRNRLSYGLKYEPNYRYSNYGRFRLTVDISRSKRDLIDDAGDVQTRILEKNIIKFGLRHSYRTGKIYTTQQVEYVDYNYDESYIGLSKLTSFDFHFWRYEFNIKYAFTKTIKAKIGFKSEKRNYDERKSYSFDKLFSEIRNYSKNTFDLNLYYTPVKWADLNFEGEFGRRKENFENFYGNDIRKWKLGANLVPFWGHQTKLSFTYRTKDYGNYYTTNIGITNRVSIEYAIFKLEHFYNINNYLKARIYINAINKISNDIDFDYQNSRAGVGFIFDL